jgi:adenylate kinase family enzyme
MDGLSAMTAHCEMRRIAIVGSSGSGKSTLARQLAAALNLKVIHLDAFFWRAGWIEQPRAEFLARQRAALQTDRWVVEGNYHHHTLAARLSAADTIVFLDFPWHHCMWNALQRHWQYRNRIRPDIPAGCSEKLSPRLLWRIFRFGRDQRPQLVCELAAIEREKRVIRLTSRAAVRRFLQQTTRALQPRTIASTVRVAPAQRRRRIRDIL